MKKIMTGVYTRNGETHNFNFCTDLTTANKLRFVNSVVGLLVDGENYNSIIRDLLFDFFLIDIMTDVNVSELKKSKFFVDDVENFLEETNIVDVIKANVEIGLIAELNKAIDLNVEYKTHIHINPLNEALTGLVNTLENKINEIDLNSMMEMASMFSGMTDEFTPENIVKAYLQSDVHKKNLEEIEESEKKKN